jgi:hypothetical protein
MSLRGLDPLRRRWDPVLRATYQQASCVLGLAPYVRGLLASLSVQRFELMLGPGIDQMPGVGTHGANGCDVKLLFVGRVVRTKGTRDAIRALGLVRDLPVSLDVMASRGNWAWRTGCDFTAGSPGRGSRISTVPRISSSFPATGSRPAGQPWRR